MRLLYSTVLLLLISLLPVSSFAQETTADSSTSFKVSGVCIQCKQRIEKALKIKGINQAVWDIPTQMLSVNYKPALISLQDIHAKVAAVGHDTELKKASDKVYNQLDDCCHYREAAVHAAHAGEAIELPGENDVTGLVLHEDNKGNINPLVGATVKWAGASQGTSTNEHGYFIIPKNDGNNQLSVSFSGFRTDTILVTDKNDLQIMLAPKGALTEVRVIAKQRNTSVNQRDVFRITNISSGELLKAACCNLSESFETNPSVDVSYSDAVTGSKQIQLLGLSGNYTQLTVENLPGPRGLATPLGLNSIAGTWVESIQLSKGTGSVVNGFESIAGQINVELKKPESAEQLYANGYYNSMGKTDLNLNLAKKLNDRWSTALLLHDNFLNNKTDFNKDGFRDLPTGNQFSAIHRWKYDGGKGFMFQFGAKLLTDDKTGGELDFESREKFSNSKYGLGIKTNRYEGFAKIGYVFPGKKYRSIGLQLAAFKHEQDAYFGMNAYDARQDNFYANLIYQDIIGNTNHKYRAGISFSSDKYDELYKTHSYARKETVPGAFVEYTYSLNENFNVVAGIREDYNSLFGWFATPRINLRYAPFKGTTIRLSAGRGQRTANVFAENMGALVSARTVVLPAAAGKAYGLDPEVAWNKGISIDQQLRLFNKAATFSVDFYRNDFTNQVVTDLEDPRLIKFYNLEGKSFSNSLQAELSLTPVRNFDVRFAYRWFDVKTTYGNKLLQKPFTAINRAFTNLAYEYRAWKFDYTLNYVGQKRIPSTAGNPVEYSLPTKSPGYFTMNAQVSKSFGKEKAFELYVGGENLGNYFQQRAILSADQPFSNYFDASMIWGPVSGRQVYGGFRYKIK